MSICINSFTLAHLLHGQIKSAKKLEQQQLCSAQDISKGVLNEELTRRVKWAATSSAQRVKELLEEGKQHAPEQ